MRIFIAVNFGGAFKDALIKVRDSLKNNAKVGKFTKDDNLHLTLCFLGEVEERRLNALFNALKDVKSSPISMSLGSLGKFRSFGRGELYYVGVNGETDKLKALHKVICDKLSLTGFTFDAKPFKAHVTIGREVQTERSGFVEIPKSSTSVESFEIMESKRENGKLVYKTLLSVKYYENNS